jgi:hypothetical protein
MPGPTDVYAAGVVPTGAQLLADLQAPVADARGKIIEYEPEAMETFVIRSTPDL